MKQAAGFKWYLFKILSIFSGVFFIVNFGLVISWGYLMSNSSGQMRFFAVKGFVLWTIFLFIGIFIMSVLARPVVRGIEMLREDVLDDGLLIGIVKRNSWLPLLSAMVIVALIMIMAVIVYTTYRIKCIGIISSVQIWALAVPACLAFVIIMYGSVSLVTNPLIDLFRDECARRGLQYPVRPTSLQIKLWAIFLIFTMAAIMWMGIVGFYEGICRIQEDFREYILASQHLAITRSSFAEGEISSLDAVKGIADDLIAAGIGAAFITDRNGHILYNPKDADVYNSTWEDIGNAIRDTIRSGRSAGMYENVHEQVIVCSPVDENYSIGTVRGIHNRIASFKQFFIMSALLTALAIAVVFIAGFTFFRSIALPIRQTIKKIRDIADGEGDLTMRMMIVSHDDTGTLAEGFNTFVDKMERMISDMKMIAENLSVGAREVAAGSQDLSDSMQEQASAVEEIVSTINEMTTSIQQNASHASKGNEKVGQMVDLARVMEKASSDLVSSMGEITLASQKIGQIIIAIEQVAFQTNILALNAAVEAARAGEHGDGFAVVAEEVRTLAHRTTQEASHVKELVEDMMKKISIGQEMVYGSESTLSMVLSQIMEVSQIVQEITEANSEQAIGIENLNRAIMQIDQNTLGSTSTSVQLASTSQSLSTDAGSLAGHVKRFKVSEAINPEQQGNNGA